MAKKPVRPLIGDDSIRVKEDEIECTYLIDQEQLDGAKIYTNREEYIKTLPKGIKFMEAGVAWGYYSELVAQQTDPELIHLIDFFYADSKCWSWREFGECQCEPVKHEILYTGKTQVAFIENKFNKYKNFKMFKGDARLIVPTLTETYDYIYLDTLNDRLSIRPLLRYAAEKTKVGSIIGLNDYVIFDGITSEVPYSTPNVVNEFLKDNKNWHVDGLALHSLGFYDIYIKRRG
jgi:hypothetical protein